ncbi:MAG: N-acetylmuramoyl-L-alanine amidase [Methanomassiliicoccales archaeon]
MAQPVIEQLSSPNFRPGRGGRKPIAIVEHITAGQMPGTLSWLRNPKAKASAHYLVTKNGRIIQLVRDEDTAYTVGNVQSPDWAYYDGTNPNSYTLNVEHEALAGESLTESQYQASLWLHILLVDRWNIPIDNDHIIGHYRIDSVNRPNDPGPGFPWQRLFTDLQAATNPAQMPHKEVFIRIGKKRIKGLLAGNKAYAWVRELAVALGKQVVWHEDLKAVVIPPAIPPRQASEGIVIQVGNISLPAMMMDNRAMAPVREVAEALGFKVTWNEATNTVNIV